MTNKIAIAVIVALVIAIIVPTAYAQQRDVSQEAYLDRCDNIFHDDRGQWHEFGCTYFPEIWGQINALHTMTQINSGDIFTLFDKTDDIESRLLVLEGKVVPPHIPLTVHVMPDVINQGQKFTVYGSADRVEQSWVDFVVYNPNGTQVQTFDIETLQNGGFFPPPIETNAKWNMSGNYTISAIHGEHETVNATIGYMRSQPLP